MLLRSQPKKRFGLFALKLEANLFSLGLGKVLMIGNFNLPFFLFLTN